MVYFYTLTKNNWKLKFDKKYSSKYEIFKDKSDQRSVRPINENNKIWLREIREDFNKLRDLKKLFMVER